MIVVNKIPIRTTNNFKVNESLLDFEIPNNLNFRNYIIKGPKKIVSLEKNNSIESLIGIKVNKFLETNINLDNYEILKETIVLEYDFNNDNLIDHIKINALKGSKAHIIILYKGKANFHYLIMDNNIQDNADIKISIIALNNDGSNSFIALNNRVYENAKVDSSIIDLMGKIRISNYYSELLGLKAKDNLNSIYFGYNNDYLDMNYHIKSKNKMTSSNIEVVGVLDDNAEKVCKMTIDFESGASKSKGSEYEKCILLSDNAVSKSVPLLLCTEEDVEGEHAVATGKLDFDKMFYVMTRGFSYDEVKKLLILGELKKIIDMIENEEIENMILDNLSMYF